MHTPDQIGTSALARSLRAPGAMRRRFGRFELDEVKGCLLRDGKVVALPPTPFAVLCALVRQPGTLLSKNALLDEVWGHQFVSDSVLKTVISELRTLLDDDARQPRFIETVSRRGYRFIAAVNTSPSGSLGLAAVAANGLRQAQPFIGREEELSRLHRAWDGACGGRCEVVWVAGEPGIGKTRLVEQFIDRLDDVVCVRGHCVEHHGTGEPYLPVLEALAELCRFDGSVSPLLRAVAPSWLLQLPWLSSAGQRDALRGELPRLGLDGMLREMGEVLDRYTEGRPLLLVTEDLHWSDHWTIQLIDYIARRRGSARLMWLASFRPAEVIALNHPLNRVRHELRLHGMCEEVMLDPFSEAEVGEYVAQHRPSLAGDEAFVRALHERTDGVPLFVASVMGDVSAPAASDGDALAQLANREVPKNLTAIIDHYFAKLETEQRMLLSAAAVCGVEFRVSMISHALERDGAWVGQACEELARQQLWLRAPHRYEESDAPEQPYSFRHALFRQVLYERTAPLARAQLQRKVRAALEKERPAGVPVTAAELAMHS
jgi:DNA-binding winged helix-turn-helix (wHTH) protein